jgi:hypothetical protein
MYRTALRVAATAVAAGTIILMAGFPAFAAPAPPPATYDLPTVVDNIRFWVMGILGALARRSPAPKPTRRPRSSNWLAAPPTPAAPRRRRTRPRPSEPTAPDHPRHAAAPGGTTGNTGGPTPGRTPVSPPSEHPCPRAPNHAGRTP